MEDSGNHWWTYCTLLGSTRVLNNQYSFISSNGRDSGSLQMTKRYTGAMEWQAAV